MKKAVAVSLMLMSSAVIAEDEGLNVQEGIMIPFTLTTPAGGIDGPIGGRVKVLGNKELEKENGWNTSTLAIDVLLDRQCGLHFSPEVSSGRLNAKDGIVVIECLTPNGAIIAQDVAGTILDINGKAGIAKLDYGVPGYVRVDEPFQIVPGTEFSNK